ncbi:MAG TPA: hypothetical protein VE082_02785, partial [Desulfobaccales bacterium]|nr:hypothetical protein [Desulfobaccales bacterium]
MPEAERTNHGSALSSFDERIMFIKHFLSLHMKAIFGLLIVLSLVLACVAISGCPSTAPLNTTAT